SKINKKNKKNKRNKKNFLLSFPQSPKSGNPFSFVIPAEPKKRESIFFCHSRRAKKAGIHFILSFPQSPKSGNPFHY
ncbi:hypothetical protein KJ700_01745, partial [Patescibacteria group bacterium]|nr:hypothetical protein [Patescibacteria group bacterium]